eukprot:CAMPEP_0171020690 /NCGR_PEP_ID=MMETSP0736-20130129/30099_1 /TAXON_ID=186038 /ORGANISM="Fragilariopsis kerguelensis, Strain L26-C5" /LENGTH=78 /DNA_ID=CAMNT_0011458607 /DNA_START=40 /DNA_END=273 /DNA_ORIENTATION=+
MGAFVRSRSISSRFVGDRSTECDDSGIGIAGIAAVVELDDDVNVKVTTSVSVAKVAFVVVFVIDDDDDDDVAALVPLP